jgi:hypothetical protein
MASFRCILVGKVCVIGGPDGWDSRSLTSPCFIVCFVRLWCVDGFVLEVYKVGVGAGWCVVWELGVKLCGVWEGVGVDV